MSGSEDKGADYEAPESKEGESSKVALADEVFDCLKADDRKGFRSALHEYVLACIEKE